MCKSAVMADKTGIQTFSLSELNEWFPALGGKRAHMGGRGKSEVGGAWGMGDAGRKGFPH